jgi:hypothetical protein
MCREVARRVMVTMTEGENGDGGGGTDFSVGGCYNQVLLAPLSERCGGNEQLCSTAFRGTVRRLGLTFWVRWSVLSAGGGGAELPISFAEWRLFAAFRWRF